MVWVTSLGTFIFVLNLSLKLSFKQPKFGSVLSYGTLGNEFR